jgi:hypothetical protein
MLFTDVLGGGGLPPQPEVLSLVCPHAGSHREVARSVAKSAEPLRVIGGTAGLLGELGDHFRAGL